VTNAALFKTVHSADGLKFWQKGTLNMPRVREYIDLDARDIARLTGVAKSSVRYDAKAPKEVQEHLQNIANICNLVFEFFQDDVKTKLWLQTPNPMLGNVSPRDMIRFGRFNKLMRFVTQALDEGSRDAEATTTSAAAP
jgi:uncharacterized protein (DUF2384 family)